jgi:hypothetical protein
MVTLNSEEPNLPCEVEVANLCESVTGNIHLQFKVANLCEAGTGNIHQEQSLPREFEMANLCEAVTGNINPDSRLQTCVKQEQKSYTPIKVGPC